MRVKFLVTILVSLMMIPSSEVRSQDATNTSSQQIILQNPTPGKVLQGTIMISANIDVEGFLSAEVSFSYANDPRDTWFLIQEIQDPIADDVIAKWDTTIITDGEYTLRLIVITEQDQYASYVTGLRVRNYTPIETSTPTPISALEPADTLSLIGTPTETSTQVPLTPTPLPPNPAQLTTDDVTMSLGTGAVLAIGALILFGIYLFLRNKR
jgi:hypothetical protein